MPKRVIDVRDGTGFLDFVSYGRGGSERPISLSRAQIEQIARTVGRTPEVMVKVLLKDSNNAGSVQKHIDYIGRRGDVELEADDGSRLRGKDAGKELLSDWDLDLETHRRESEFAKTRGRVAPKLVHKLMFSMPPGTPAKGVLAAAQNFAREQFALKHRYVMALHTDEPHPHVHMVVKAMSEQGVRLNIRKATLREWRREFARHLREQGIAANATERFVRGETKSHKLDGIYRASRRDASSYVRAQAETVARELSGGGGRAEPGKRRLIETRAAVQLGWQSVAQRLSLQGENQLAADVVHFVGGMNRILTDRERLARSLLAVVSRASPHQARVP